MKNIKIFVASALCLFFLTACPGSAYETLYSRSFVLEYLCIDGISGSRDYFGQNNGLVYGFSFSKNYYCGIDSEGILRETYDALCEKYGDVTYNRDVRFSLLGPNNPRCASSFTGLKITSTAAWDENHPTGSDLGDIVRFESDTPLPYIRSGYTKKYAETQGGEYYPVDRLVSELTQDDMTLLSSYGFALRFTHAPTLSRQHTLTFTLTDDEGKEYSASVGVDFDALDPK